MPSPITWVRHNQELVVLCGATFLVMAGQGVVSPIIPLYASDFGVSATMVGLTLTVFAFARLILNVPAGLIADRYGRRVLLVGGPLLTAIGMFGSGQADGIWVLLAWRFVAGAGSAFYMSGAMTYLIDIAPPEKRTRYVATNQWALSVGVALGPGVGGLIANAYSLSTPFTVVAVLAVVTSIYAAFRLPETRDRALEEQAAAEAAPPVSTWAFVRSTPFLLVGLSTMTIFMTRAGTRGTLMPLHASEVLGWGPAEVGLVFTLTGLLTLTTLLPAAWAADHIGRRSVVLFSGVFAGLGAILAGSLATPVGFVLGNIVMSLGTGTAGPAPAAYVADIAPPGRRGMAIAMYRSAGDLGFLAAPPLLGLLSEVTSIGFTLGVGGTLAAVGGIVFFVGSLRDHRAGKSPAAPHPT
ncbi:MAG: MFS transporter [Acidimicrobiales bacterium]